MYLFADGHSDWAETSIRSAYWVAVIAVWLGMSFGVVGMLVDIGFATHTMKIYPIGLLLTVSMTLVAGVVSGLIEVVTRQVFS